jgi:hypothetical protein
MAKKGLYANIHAKRKRGATMRKKGDPGAPSAQDFKDAAKTAKAYGGMKMKNYAGGGKMLKYGKGGEFGMLSVKAGYDNNPKATAADRIVGAKKNKAMHGMKMKNKAMGGMKMKYGHGGRMQHD